MVKNAYMLQGGYGRGGATIAMFRRCEAFINKGIHCVSLTVDFFPEIYDYLGKSKVNEWLPAELEFKNPFIDLSVKAEFWLENVGHRIAHNFLLCYLEGDTVVYYKSNGYRFNQETPNKNNRVSYFEHKGKVISETFLINGLRIEYNYSLKGMCICIKEYSAESNKQLKCLVFDYSLGIVKYYKSSYHWNIAWMRSILPKKENTVLICDGPGSARKILEVKSKNIKAIHVLHNNHKYTNGNIVQRDKWNLDNRNQFDALVPLTEGHKKDLIDDFEDSNFYNILNFTKTTEIKSISKYKPLRIGFFGQLYDRKGVKDAINTLVLLHNKYNLAATLDVYGARPSPADTEKAISSYRKMVKEKKLESFVTFHGYINNVPEEMSSCHCVLFPSYTEAQGLTILESMHLGVPVVAYDCKYGPSVMIDNGENGYLCEVGNVNELAEKINYLFTHDSVRENFSSLARDKSKIVSDSDKIFQQWEDMFDILFSDQSD